MTTLKRIHITGGPGGGKTTLASRLSATLDAPVLDLDGMALRLTSAMTKPIDFDRLISQREAEIAAFAANERWISEGAFIGESLRLLKDADLIVWLDVPWPTASSRILLRHLKASLARNNRYPGLGNLYRFWRWTSRYYANRHEHGLNEWRSPNTRATLAEQLEPYGHKLTVCHAEEDVSQLISQIETSSQAARS